MNSLRVNFFVLSWLFAFSACVAPAATAPKGTHAQTAGPVMIEGDRTASAVGGCKTEEGNDHLTKIEDGAEALFQILSTDANDLTTVHSRAYALAQLEQDYSESFASVCVGPGLDAQNTADRIQKLEVLGRESDAAIIHALASQIWELFHPNIGIAGQGKGASTQNPFAETAKP